MLVIKLLWEGLGLDFLLYLMGHSDISVTMNTYTHLGLADAAEEMKRLGEIVSV